MVMWLEWVAEALHNDERCMLVSVTEIKGSAPRPAGTKMVVRADSIAGTIGGGQLEHRAIQKARSILGGDRSTVSERYPLGPELDQCCGGRADLAFELFAPDRLGEIEELAHKVASGEHLLRFVKLNGEDGYTFEVKREDEHSTVTHEENCAFVDHLVDERRAVWLYGAGHVGQALMRALAPLPVRLTWIDSRAGLVTGPLPGNVQARVEADPATAAKDAPAGAFHLVMTHSHPMDEAVCEAVLRRGDFAYLGLIGSASKRKSFSRRLFVKGLGRDDLDRLHCPIGLDGIRGKEPAVIAASVAADLLMRLEAAGDAPREKTGDVEHGRRAAASHAAGD